MLFLGLAALGILAAGCSKDLNPDNGKGKASMRITINGESSTRAVGTPSADLEKTVHSFTVYVFNNSSGVLEASETFTSGLEGTVSGLGVASQKKVVVFVNQPAVFPAVTNYSDFATAATMIDLSTQVPGDFQTTGLFMSGQTSAPVTLSAESTVSVPVTVRRLAAKVRLGALTINPAEGLELSDFELTGVSIQQARDKYDALGVNRTAGFGYVGGVQAAGSGLTPVSYLNELYALPAGYTAGTALAPQIYFYVLPNDNTDGNATLINIYGTYQGQDTYFPFVINGETGEGSSTTDGTYIQRNRVYTLNVTLAKIASGGEDPNVPNQEVSMSVEVTVADWEDELIQNVEW